MRFYDRAIDADFIAAQFQRLESGQVPGDHARIRFEYPIFRPATAFLRDDQSYEQTSHALFFDGAGAHVQTPLQLGEQEALTVGAWIRPESLDPRKPTYVLSQNATNEAGFALLTHYRKGLAAYLVTDQGFFSATAENVLEAGTWQHVAFSWDGQSLRIYHNGLPVGAAVATRGRLKPYARPLFLGRPADRDWMHFHGRIDEVRVMTRAFDDAVIEGAGEPVETPAINALSDRRTLPVPIAVAGKEPVVAPLIDFEDLSGWRVQTRRGYAEATLTRTQEERAWGDYAARLTFKRGLLQDPRYSVIRLVPPEPVAVPQAIDAVNLWVFGRYWGPGQRGPVIAVEIEDRHGAVHEIELKSREYPFVFWTGWSVASRNLADVIEGPSRLVSLLVKDFDGAAEETIYLDSLATFLREKDVHVTEELPTWETIGAPTTPETIVPPLERVTRHRAIARVEGPAFVLGYEGEDETVLYRYTPAGGGLGDIELLDEAGTLRPMAGGGFVFEIEGRELVPGQDPELGVELLEAGLTGGRVTSRWQWSWREHRWQATLQFSVLRKSLVIDLAVDQPFVKVCRFGSVAGLEAYRLVDVPYLVLRGGLVLRSQDPAVLSFGDRFLSCFADWYHSDASELIGQREETDGGVRINGGAFYHPKTDGQRNPARERFVLTVSERFSEVLPNIPNPPNRWRDLTREGIWVTRMWYLDRAPFEGYFEKELDFYRLLRAYGMENLLIRHHVNLYRQYLPARGAPSTLTNQIAPEIGTASDLAHLIDLSWEELGYRVGLYTNSTLINPQSVEIWDEQHLTYDLQGQWRYGSGPSKQVKPTMVLPLQREHQQAMKRLFNPRLSYPDQYTCKPPWAYVDYDHRMQGAGKFSTVFRVFAESLLEEGRIVEGPILSEGIHQWMLAGFCDSYGQPGRPDQDTLVDFQLRRLHPLSNDTGFHLSVVSSTRHAEVDRLLAAQIAYGHIGHLFGCYGTPALERVSLSMVKS